jgi:transposase
MGMSYSTTRPPLLKLTKAQRKSLRHFSRNADGRLMRRAQALLWLGDGECVSHVAQRLQVSRQTLYDTVARFQERAGRPFRERLQDEPHTGRPATARAGATQMVQELLPQPPTDFGYRAPDWTVGMLQTQVQQRHGGAVSAATVTRALHDAGYRYKRPRYVLARRDPHWRQVKGGSSAASKAAGAP